MERRPQRGVPTASKPGLIRLQESAIHVSMSEGVLMRDLPMQERPRERVVAVGAAQAKTEELVAILLRTGTKGKSVLTIAEELVARYKSLNDLAKASLEDLQTTKGIGRDKAVTLQCAFMLAQRMAKEIRAEAPLLETPESIANLLREDNRHLGVESFQIVLLNTRRRLIGVHAISQGTLDTLLVHPREVFKPAISAGAAAIILAHNHPSGDPTPSEADIKVTRDLIRAGQLLKIEVLDHVILGQKTEQRQRDYVSLREMGYFYS